MATKFTPQKYISKLTETTQGKTASTVGATILTTVALVFLALRPAWVSISDRVTDNNRKTDYLDEAAQKISAIQDLNASYETQLDTVKLLDNILPKEPTESFLVKNLTAMAADKNVLVQNLQVEKPEALTDDLADLELDIIKQMEVSIFAYGELNELESFITALEKFPIIINIDKINYTTVEQSEISSKSWQLSIKAHIYFWDVDNITDNLNG